MSIKTVEKLLEKSGGSVYRLVSMASKRALELSDGRKCLLESPTTDKVTTLALEEIASGKVDYLNGKGSTKPRGAKAQEPAKKTEEVEA